MKFLVVGNRDDSDQLISGRDFVRISNVTIDLNIERLQPVYAILMA